MMHSLSYSPTLYNPAMLQHGHRAAGSDREQQPPPAKEGHENYISKSGFIPVCPRRVVAIRPMPTLKYYIQGVRQT